MPPAPPTDHEELRLATLVAQNILDTGQDKRFDNIVQLAADMFDVPIAVISLVDQDRQWFKAVVGLDARETPRDQAFCAHAIHRPDEVLLVEDATLDPRFVDNPLVTGNPGIRFYAGAPFRAANGEPLGTLCLIDRAPRTLTPAECTRLQDLSRSVGAMVDLHRSAVDLQRAATHDRLTGLANRALFETRVDAAVLDGLAGRPCAVLMGNLAGFGRINDDLGHEIGDGLLCAIARRLSNARRRPGGPHWRRRIRGTARWPGGRRHRWQCHAPDRRANERAVPHWRRNPVDYDGGRQRALPARCQRPAWPDAARRQHPR
jgi:GAF domain-containing protein